MLISRFMIALAFVLTLALILGCSSGNSPVTPGENTAGTLDSIPIIGLTDAGTVFSATGLLGAYELTINHDNITADLVSKRTGTIGEDFIVSGIAFFTIAPCQNCLKLKGLSLDYDGNLVVTFSISHPFEKGDLLKPPSGINRLDLDVFDLAMVIVPLNKTPETYSFTGISIQSNVCSYPSGYTAELSEVLNENVALPYSLIVDDSIEEGSTWNRFEMGTKDFEFEVLFGLSTGTLQFDLYLTMGYGASAKKSDRLIPKYYNPEFNRKAAWKVVVTPPEADDPPAMGNTWQDNDNTTEFDVAVVVYDWQQIATVYGTPEDFENAPSDLVYAASKVAGVSVEIPGMNNTLPTAVDPPTGSGMPDDPLIFNVAIANENLLTAGEYTGLVKVTDERAVGEIPPLHDRDYLIDCPAGTVLFNYTIPEYATYQTFVATVVAGNLSPVADAEATTAESIFEGMPVTFDATGSYDPDGSIVLYEWDFDEDGAFAETPDDDYTGDPWNPTHYFALGDGAITVQLRVTDNGDATDVLDAPTTIMVYQSKKIDVTNTGTEAVDLAVDHSNGDVLVLYANGDVRRYDCSDFLQSFSPISTSQPGDSKYIDVAENGYWFVVKYYEYSLIHDRIHWVHYNSADTYVNFYFFEWYLVNSDFISQSAIDAVCMSDIGDHANDHAGVYGGHDRWNVQRTHVRGRYDPGFTSYSWYYTFSKYVAQSDYGLDVLAYDFVVAAEADPASDRIWLVEKRDCVATRWSYIDNGHALNYDGPAFGTSGTPIDGNNGIYNPLDITCDNQNHMYILDELFNQDRTIKAYSYNDTSTTALGSFGDDNDWLYEAVRIDGSQYNGSIVLLSKEGENAAISIFTESETPDS